MTSNQRRFAAVADVRNKAILFFPLFRQRALEAPLYNGLELEQKKTP
jgi:hypothetical protein